MEEREIVCGTCGHTFVVQRRGGRPKMFCSAACKDVSTALSLLRSRIHKVEEQATDKAWKEIRSDLWRVGNRRGVNQYTGRER